MAGPYSPSDLAEEDQSSNPLTLIPGIPDYKLTRRLLSTDKSANPRSRYASEALGKYTSTLGLALAGAGIGGYLANKHNEDPDKRSEAVGRGISVGAGVGAATGLLAALAGRAIGQLRAPRTEAEQDKHNASTLGMALNYIVPGKGSYERGRRSRYAMAQDKLREAQRISAAGLPKG